jgi:GrpB-like predicted nucleotidyltransferase (UPF0157 family)
VNTESDDPIIARSREILIGEPDQNVTVTIVNYDVRWPEQFEIERAKIAAALDKRTLAIEHIGSTSVPGLAAKPIIDILLVVPDSSDEAAYVPALTLAGYELRVREPDWHEHRMFRTPERRVHLHVFSAGSTEIDRHLLLRDRLRDNDDAVPCTKTRSVGWLGRIGRPSSTTPTRRRKSSKRSLAALAMAHDRSPTRVEARSDGE